MGYEFDECIKMRVPKLLWHLILQSVKRYKGRASSKISLCIYGHLLKCLWIDGPEPRALWIQKSGVNTQQHRLKHNTNFESRSITGPSHRLYGDNKNFKPRATSVTMWQIENIRLAFPFGYQMHIVCLPVVICHRYKALWFISPKNQWSIIFIVSVWKHRSLLGMNPYSRSDVMKL